LMPARRVARGGVITDLDSDLRRRCSLRTYDVSTSFGEKR
jgi:hypothetical protein